MGRIESGAFPINTRTDETTYSPDGFAVTTRVELENPEPNITTGVGHEAEAAHVTIAQARHKTVHYARASMDEGETGVDFDPVVAAAHLGVGDAWDSALLELAGADRGTAGSEAQLTLSTRRHRQKAIAELLAVQGFATGNEMARVAEEADQDLALGKKVVVTTTIVERDGTITKVQRRGRARDPRVMEPGKWTEVRPQSRGAQANPRRRTLALAA